MTHKIRCGFFCDDEVTPCPEQATRVIIVSALGHGVPACDMHGEVIEFFRVY